MKNFFNSIYYLIIIFLISIISWSFKLTYIYIIFAIISALVVIHVKLSRDYLIPLILGGIISYQSKTENIFYIILFALIFLILIYDMIKNNVFKINKIIINYFVLLIVIIISLFFSLSIMHAVFGLIQAIFWFLILYYFYLHKNENTIYYIAKSYIFLLLTILMQMLIYFLTKLENTFLVNFNNFDLYFASYEQISAYFIIGILLLSYKYFQKEKVIYYLLILLFGFIYSFFTSKGSYISNIVQIIPFIILFINNTQRKKLNFKIVLGFSIFVLLFRLFISIPTGLNSIWYERITEGNQAIKDLALQSLYDAFKTSPIFGLGINNAEVILKDLNILLDIDILVPTKLFHNFIFQSLSTLGLIGLFVLIYLFYTIISSLNLKSKLNYIILLIIFVYLIQGFFDNIIFDFGLMTILSLVLAVIEDKKKEDFYVFS